MAAGNDVANEKKKPVSIQPGSVIRCKTNLGDSFEGEVMGYDEESRAVVIKCKPAGKTVQKSIYDVIVINLSLVDQSNFELISLPKGELPPLPDIDKEKIDKRLKSAKDRVGIGVTPDAQELFDFIRKTIQECYWNGQNITVLEDVKITPPYTQDKCTGKDTQAVEYIKNIVSKFHNEKDSCKPLSDEVLNT